jgi:dCTP deaminase
MNLSHKHIKAAFDTGLWKAWRNGKQVSSDQLTINPNSVNVSLGKTILIPKIISNSRYIELHNAESVEWLQYSIGYVGYPFEPGQFMLGHVRERFDCSAPIASGDGALHYFAPMIEGRSTVARCGLSIHETAGFGDFNFSSTFTVELSCKLPIKLHEGDEIAQVYFTEVSDGSVGYQGAYTSQHDAPKAPVLGKDRFARWK